MKKNIFIFAVIATLILGSATASFAQVEKSLKFTNEEFFKNSEFILEVEGVDHFGVPSIFSYDAKGNCDPNDFYTCQYCKVKRIYKGEANKVSIGDTITILKKGGEPGQGECGFLNDNVSGLIVQDGDTFIVFMEKSDFPACEREKYGPIVTNNIKEANKRFIQLKHLQDDRRAKLSVWGKVTGLNGLSFENRDELRTYMQQFESFGVDADAYHKDAEKYYQKKIREIDEFMRNYPQMSIPKTERIYEIDSLRTETIIKIIRTPIPTIKEFKGVKKIDDLQIELDDFQRLERQKIDSILNEINILKKSIIEKKNTLRSESDTKLWVIIHNQQIYYDNVLDMNFLEFDYC